MGKQDFLGFWPKKGIETNLSSRAEDALERIAFALERIAAQKCGAFSSFVPDSKDLPPEAEFENFDEEEAIKNEQDELNRRRRDDRVRDLQRRG